MKPREDIIKLLQEGIEPKTLVARGYPKQTVYGLYEKLQAGWRGGLSGVNHKEVGGGESNNKSTSSKTGTTEQVEKETGALQTIFSEAITLGDLDKVRAAFGITFRPRAISMPTPELLYTAMVIAIVEFNFPLMPPQDFIDVVLYQWLGAAGIIPRAYLKISELEEVVKQYGYNLLPQGAKTEIEIIQEPTKTEEVQDGSPAGNSQPVNPPGANNPKESGE